MNTATWNEIDEIDVVYLVNPSRYVDQDWGHGLVASVVSPPACVEVDGIAYPKAYVVEHDNKNMTRAAMAWANGHGVASPKVVRTANEGFTVRIVGTWYDQFRGQESLWPCLFEKEGMEPFVTGINPNDLFELMERSTLVNGRADEMVFFARRNGQLVVLHEQMASYQEFRDTIARKKLVSTGKTTKWKIGHVYATMRNRDVMLGEVPMPLKKASHHYGKTVVHEYELDLDVRPTRIFGSLPVERTTWACGINLETGDGHGQLDDFEACAVWGMKYPRREWQKRCPARHCDGPAPFATDNHEMRLVGTLEKVCELVRDRLLRSCSGPMDDDVLTCWVELAGYHLALYRLAPERGLDALDILEGAMRQLNFANAQRATYKLSHDGVTESFDSPTDLIARAAQLAREHNKNRAQGGDDR